MTSTRGRALPASEPYRWPCVGELTGARLAVVVTGASPWFVRRCPGWDRAGSAVAAVVAAARSAGALVVWTLHHGRTAHLPAPGDPLGDLCAEAGPHDQVVPAAGLDAFHGGPLDQLLRSEHRDLLVLAGAGFETTVHSTLRSANDRGYECLTLLDASAPIDATLAAACASMICMSGGIFGAVGYSAELISHLTSLEKPPCPSPR